MLNSMWGKFGQLLNKTQVKEFDDPQAFHHFLDTDKLDVRHVSVMNDAMVEVFYQYQDEEIPVSPLPEHFCGRVHHVLGPTPPLRSLGTVRGTRLVL